MRHFNLLYKVEEKKLADLRFDCFVSKIRLELLLWPLRPKLPRAESNLITQR